MATLKDVKAKINGVQKTKQITQAMHMVAVSKLRGAQTRMEGFRPYANKYAQIIEDVVCSGNIEGVGAILLPSKNSEMMVHILLCTSDRGLCGGFNLNLINIAAEAVKRKKQEGKRVSFTCVGKKGMAWCLKEGHEIVNSYENVLEGRFTFKEASQIGGEVIQGFFAGKYQEVHLIFSEFVRATYQIPQAKQLLPIQTEIYEQKKKKEDITRGYLMEPSAQKLLAKLLLDGLYTEIYRAFLENATSENAARMTAMNNATLATNDILDSLKIAYNKARQAAITSELIDIVGGAEALAG